MVLSAGRQCEAGSYSVLSVIPIKHAYTYENQVLRNRFVPPFDAFEGTFEIDDETEGTHYPVTDASGRSLFRLSPSSDMPRQQRIARRISNSFSYNHLLSESDENTQPAFSRQTRLWSLLFVILLTIYVGYVLYLFFRKWRNHAMLLRQRIQLLIATTMVSSFLAIFIVSDTYLQHSYQQQQQEDLSNKTLYIQKSLQEAYFWVIDMDQNSMPSLNVELQDLSFTYQTDIHVFDLRGQMIGTSQPLLFERKIVSTLMSPAPLFSRSDSMIQTERIGDLDYLCAYIPMLNGDYVQIGYIGVPLFISSDKLIAERDQLIGRLLPIYVIVILIGLLFSFVATHQITASVKMLVRRMGNFRIGDENQHIDYQRNDELKPLVSQYNHMLDQLNLTAQLIAKSERETAWQTMARQVAHEIKNPLTPMRLTIQQLQRMKERGGVEYDEYFKRSTETLIEQIDNLSRIASSFSAFAKLPDPQVESVDVAQKLSAVVTLFANNAEGVELTYVGEEHGIYALTDSEQITQVFNNLIKNALQAVSTQTGGRVKVNISSLAEWVSINVIDNGVGIPEDIRDKIFMPNFTTKSTGMGLGLAICKKIVEGSGGKISFACTNRETTFTIELRKAGKDSDNHADAHTVQ